MGLNIFWTKRRAALSIAECMITLSSALVPLPYIIYNKNLHFVRHFLGAHGPISGKIWKKVCDLSPRWEGGIKFFALLKLGLINLLYQKSLQKDLKQLLP